MSGTTTTDRPQPCSLCRHYDERDVLLYVGITGDVSTRTKSHARRSDWSRYAVRFTGQWFPDRSTAEAAEQSAIVSERPVFNRDHTEGDPWARIEQYLAERRSGIGRYGRQRERFVTLKEAAQEQHVTNLTSQYLRKCRRDRLGNFPRHAGREFWFWKLYNEDEIQNWTETGGPDITFWSRTERSEWRVSERRDARQRSRGASESGRVLTGGGVP